MSLLSFTAEQTTKNRKSFLGVLWALSILLYEVEDSIGSQTIISRLVAGVVFLAATFLLIRPQDDRAWILLGISVPVQILTLLPSINNHSVLFAILGVAVLVSVLVPKVTKQPTATDWLAHSEPFIRLVILIGYGSAAIAKLNTGFYNYKISCANSIATEVFSWLPFKIPFGDFFWLPVVVSATELFVFIGLIFAATRPWALIVASAFHFLLSLNYTAAGLAFNPALFSMLVFFLPSSASNELVAGWDRLKNRLGQKARLGIQIVFWASLAAIFIMWKLVPVNMSMLIPTFVVVELVSTLMFALIVVLAFRHRKTRLESKLVSTAGTVSWIVLIVMVLNAAMPYLGGKTGATLSMYSNLRVEGGVSNHFFIPRLPIKTAQDDLVTIVSSSDPALENLAKKKVMITFVTLQQMAATRRNASLTYLRAGTTYQLPSIGLSDQLTHQDAFWNSLVAYRNVPEAGTCTW